LGSIVQWRLFPRRTYLPTSISLSAERGLAQGRSLRSVDATGLVVDWGKHHPRSTPLVVEQEYYLPSSRPSVTIRSDHVDQVARVGWFLPLHRRLHLQSNSHFLFGRGGPGQKQHILAISGNHQMTMTMMPLIGGFQKF
jgi:hypothetical protein